MTGGRALSMGSLLVLIAACRSTPVHFHTLVPAPAGADVTRPSALSNNVSVEPIRVPAQVDRSEMVVRQNNGEIELLSNEWWIAPLADEMRNAMSSEIHRRLSSIDAVGVHGMPPRISISVVVERFDSAPSRYALIDATWELRASNTSHQVRLTCASHVYERVGDGYIALEHGHQHAVASIADQIADAVRELIFENSAVCPADR